VLTTTLANLLNRGLPRSGRARELTAELAGRSFLLEMPGFGAVRVASDGTTLSVSADGAAADATLSAGPLGFLAMAVDDPQAVLRRGGASICGDAEVAARFRELLRLLRPDPEEELSLVIGDVPAHQLGRLARAAAEWSRRATDTAWRSGADYLAHERGDLVPRREGEPFLRGVDALREDVDRLEARLAQLARRRANRTGTP
jgi:ubiquinone biosynthesis accessory factor UbiJ